MIRWATTRPAVIWAFGGSLMLAGGLAFTRLPLATKTSVELPRLTVQRLSDVEATLIGYFIGTVFKGTLHNCSLPGIWSHRLAPMDAVHLTPRTTTQTSLEHLACAVFRR